MSDFSVRSAPASNMPTPQKAVTAEIVTGLGFTPRMAALSTPPALRPLPPLPLPPMPLPVVAVPLIKGAGTLPKHNLVKANSGAPSGGQNGRPGRVTWQAEAKKPLLGFLEDLKPRRKIPAHAHAPVIKTPRIPRSELDHMVRVLKKQTLPKKVGRLFRNIKKQLNSGFRRRIERQKR